MVIWMRMISGEISMGCRLDTRVMAGEEVITSKLYTRDGAIR